MGICFYIIFTFIYFLYFCGVNDHTVAKNDTLY